MLKWSVRVEIWNPVFSDITKIMRLRIVVEHAFIPKTAPSSNAN